MQGHSLKATLIFLGRGQGSDKKPRAWGQSREPYQHGAPHWSSWGHAEVGPPVFSRTSHLWRLTGIQAAESGEGERAAERAVPGGLVRTQHSQNPRDRHGVRSPSPSHHEGSCRVSDEFSLCVHVLYICEIRNI